ncbi:MAG: DUF3500 domain-containing protein [Chthoniobacter sp.]|nr:DUF3500 domain-containing protein [Chthoniobacter sp.]
MNMISPVDCQECAGASPISAVDRRRFFRLVGGAAVGSLASRFLPGDAMAAPLRPDNHQAKASEELVREYYASLNPYQRQQLVFPWNYTGAGTTPARLGVYNTAIGKAIGETLTKAQRELIERLMMSMSSGDDGWRKITRNGGWDTNDGILSCGAYIFGDPEGDRKYSFLFTGHHLTMRCDGNSEPNTAFGGPIFYGHIVNGYSQRNVFNEQTLKVMSVYEALNADQQKHAVVDGRPPGRDDTVFFPTQGKDLPGISGSDLSADQKGLIEGVLKDVLSPYREEDVAEVMDIVRANGGMEKIHLAFYRDTETNEKEPWSYWRLEGPGFVWNFRVLPHVHTYVSVAKV